MVFVVAITLLVTQTASAQQIINLDLILSPSNPHPEQSVSVLVRSFSADIDRSTVSWYRNGILAESGVGDDQYDFTLGGAGTIDTIRVVIQTLTGAIAEKTLVIHPSDILLIWQADSYTPPFYRGKALHTVESDTTVLVIPNIVVDGTLVPSSSLIFTWKRDGVVLGSLSGIGRDTLTFDGSVLSRATDITVTVETLDSSVEARRNLRIPVSQPILYLYERSPVLGILFNSALLDRFRMRKEETVVEAFPYFFSTKDRYKVPTYEWHVGSNLINDNTSPNITLRQGEGGGDTFLSVRAKNPSSILEISNRGVTIEFGI